MNFSISMTKKQKKTIKEEIEKEIENLSYKMGYIVYRWKEDLIFGRRVDFITPLENLLKEIKQQQMKKGL